MKKVILTAAVLLLAAVAIAHWYFSDRGRFTTAAEYTDLGRTVSGNELTSTYDPASVLKFAPEFKHIGGQKFVLYGVADTEQHFYVETTSDDKLRSVYWVQYEAYLPNKRYTYNYDDSPLRVSVGDYEFYTDTAVFHYDPTAQRKQGTDGAMVRNFLAGKGYTYPQEVVYARLVYLTDDSRQKELMIIFMDDLSSYGFTAAELEDGGAHVSKWPEIEQAHLDRIKETIDAISLQSDQENEAH